jgi:hypothetical protein
LDLAGRRCYRDFHTDYPGIPAFRTKRHTGYRVPFRCHPNVAVPLQHRPAHVAHQGKHRGRGDAGFRKAVTERVPQGRATATKGLPRSSQGPSPR